MKKKFLIMLSVMAVLCCLFAVSVSAAEIPDWSETDTAYDDEMKKTTQYGLVSDTEARIMFYDGKTYPTWYFVKTEVINDFVWLGDNDNYNRIGLDFAQFESVSGTSYSAQDVVKIEVPGGIDGIGARALGHANGFTSLVYVHVPEGVTKITKYAFKAKNEGESVLTQVILPDSIESIDEQAFHFCSSLESIHISDKVTVIPKYAFYRCVALKEITGAGGVVTVKEAGFSRCPLSKSVGNIFKNLETVETYAFYWIEQETIKLPKIKSIGKEAFRANTVAVLKNLYLNDGVEIVTDAFYNGKVENVYYTGDDIDRLKSYSGLKNATFQTVTYCYAFNDNIHTPSDENVINKTSYFEKITITNNCSVCNGESIVIQEIGPIFTYRGYSCTEKAINGFYSMTQAYSVDTDALAEYKKINPEFKYGLVAAGCENPLDENVDASKVVNYPNEKFAREYFEIKVQGISGNNMEKAVVFCLYVIDNGTYYLDNNATSENVTGISFNELHAIKYPTEEGEAA